MLFNKIDKSFKMKNKNILNAIQLSMTILTKTRKQSKIRYLFSVVFLPIVFFQSPAFAQTETPALLPLNGNGKEQINLKLVNCNKALLLDCGLAQLILPGGAFIDNYDLRLENPTNSDIKIINSLVYADGSPSNGNLQLGDRDQSLTINTTQPLPANKIQSLPIKLNRSVMYPDQYSGAVILTLGQKNRVSFPISLSVRSGPLLPLFVLFLGVVLGRLLKYMQERGEPQAKVLQEVYRLQSDIKAARLEIKDEESLIKMALEAETLVAREKLDVAPVEIKAIYDRLGILGQLKVLEDKINANAQSPELPDADTLTIDISKAKSAIAQKDDAKAKELLAQISEKINAVAPKSGVEDMGVKGVKQLLAEVTNDTSKIGSTSLISTKKPISNFKMFMITLSGVSDQIRAEATFWIVRPIFSVTLLIGLSFVGMGSLYVEKPTFGANPFADYLGLILWGMSADFASRKLVDPKGDDGK
jgi:hypothetical protein